VIYRLAYGLAWLILRTALALWGGLRVDGLEHVPRRGGILLAPNHASYSDPPIVALACPRIVWFMTRADLFRIPLLAAVMRVFHAFPVQTGGVDRVALRRSDQLLRAGEALCVFPEGGVSEDGRLQPLKPGVSLLAVRAGVPIVPVGLARTHQFLPPARRWPGFARGGVEVRFGPPILPDHLPAGMGRNDRLGRLTELVQEAISELIPAEQQAAG
jgi:1-acyl-sn-glycerol-3-phosphate acyltransferase